MTRVLLVEDSDPLRRALRTSFAARGIEVVECPTGSGGVVAAADGGIDVVVLDLGLPDLDGMDVLARIRSFSDVPVIVLSARDDRGDKIGALDGGADDYVTKPFDTEELLARVRAARRRGSATDSGPSVIRVGELEIDLARQLVTAAGDRVALTRKEMKLLEVLATNPGRLLTHEVLLRRVWGPGYGTERNYLRTFVNQLRRKLGDDATHPRLIATEPGTGYRWIGNDRT